MDRNTLTALLLITVVLILTPYYMEFISPTPQPTYETNDEPNNRYDESTDIYLSDSNSRNKETLEPPRTESTVEKITTIVSIHGKNVFVSYRLI